MVVFLRGGTGKKLPQSAANHAPAFARRQPCGRGFASMQSRFAPPSPAPQTCVFCAAPSRSLKRAGFQPLAPCKTTLALLTGVTNTENRRGSVAVNQVHCCFRRFLPRCGLCGLQNKTVGAERKVNALRRALVLHCPFGRNAFLRSGQSINNSHTGRKVGRKIAGGSYRPKHHACDFHAPFFLAKCVVGFAAKGASRECIYPAAFGNRAGRRGMQGQNAHGSPGNAVGFGFNFNGYKRFFWTGPNRRYRFGLARATH